MWTTLVLVVTVIAFLCYRSSHRPSSYPPGPFAYPIVGSAIALFPSAKDAFNSFQKAYGDICSFKVFGYWRIVLNDPGLMKSVGANSEVTGRPSFYFLRSRNVIISGKQNPSPLGIFGTYGEIWKHQRRFTLRTLRDQGFGKSSIEPVMQSELQELGDYFARKANQKISVGNTFNRSIINVLWALIIGKRFSYNDDRLQDLVDKVNRMLQAVNPFGVAINFPILKKLFPNLPVYKNIDGSMSDLLAFIEDQMEVYLKDMDGMDDPSSYVGVYLRELRNPPEDGVTSPFHMHHLKANMTELFIAGSETTSTTLWWAIYFMVTNPKVQQRVQEELDEVLGQGNIPSLEDIDRLPYTHATIYEIQRKADILPMSLPHRTLVDVTIRGYKIPKDTDVMFNLSYIFHSPKYWKHPEKFYPEHFLTEDGKVHKPEFFIPFGIGKRVCLGESLARLELFSFFSNMMQRFTWKLTDDLVTWGKAMIVSRPPDFTVFVSERNKTMERKSTAA